jgi:hypothetical protein
VAVARRRHHPHAARGLPHDVGFRQIVAEPLRLRADLARLEQAISNLLDNAVRHGASRVQISARLAGARIEVHVSDDGAGFSEDVAAHAFERFRRGGQTHSGDGAVWRSSPPSRARTTEAAAPTAPTSGCHCRPETGDARVASIKASRDPPRRKPT